MIVYFHDVLPAGQVLALNPDLPLVTVFFPHVEDTPAMWQTRLSEHAYRVLLRLLQAHPSVCSHQELLSCLYPNIALPGAGDEQECRMKPVYRAVERAMKELPQAGLFIHPVRGLGYRIVSAGYAARGCPRYRVPMRDRQQIGVTGSVGMVPLGKA